MRMIALIGQLWRTSKALVDLLQRRSTGTGGCKAAAEMAPRYCVFHKWPRLSQMSCSMALGGCGFRIASRREAGVILAGQFQHRRWRLLGPRSGRTGARSVGSRGRGRAAGAATAGRGRTCPPPRGGSGVGNGRRAARTVSKCLQNVWHARDVEQATPELSRVQVSQMPGAERGRMALHARMPWPDLDCRPGLCSAIGAR